jgi:hypothetical protein
LILAQMMLGPKTTGLPFGKRLKGYRKDDMATSADETSILRRFWTHRFCPPFSSPPPPAIPKQSSI